jgi:microcystin-dependent protein
LSEPFIGEVRMFGINFAPRGWAQCNGQLMSIAQNQALFSILGITYGGDGVQTFGLPDLRSRVPLGMGPGFPQGSKGGEETHMLTTGEVPSHSHTVQASSTATGVAPPNNDLLASVQKIYAPPSANVVPMIASSVSTVGGTPHQNLQPYNVVNILIALNGVYPPRN